MNDMSEVQKQRLYEQAKRDIYERLKQIHAGAAEAFMMMLQGNTTVIATSHSFTAPEEAVEHGLPPELTVVMCTAVLAGTIEEHGDAADLMMSAVRDRFPDDAQELTQSGQAGGDNPLIEVTKQ